MPLYRLIWLNRICGLDSWWISVDQNPGACVIILTRKYYMVKIYINHILSLPLLMNVFKYEPHITLWSMPP